MGYFNDNEPNSHQAFVLWKSYLSTDVKIEATSDNNWFDSSRELTLVEELY